ncbi:hypothetical protein PTTG_27034 [Puccinia triticina 1-1 BBBD Race 1]|uniref:Uncharacterized protein n=1 Tax=Puccinia triticina (isolate 1-1 / race 1 (BBBD)) TaxID=630390 RepID=A0A180GNP2_PUCT1|nr:hypothetical protein PTTG_27034 [Puccinia triticina 1-1 BBBD Race 1]
MSIFDIALRRCHLTYLVFIWGLTIVSVAYELPPELVSVEGTWETIDEPILLDGVAYSADAGGAFNPVLSPQPSPSDFFSLYSNQEPTTWSPNTPHHHYPTSPDGTRFRQNHEVLMPTISTLFQNEPSSSSRGMMNQATCEIPTAPPDRETTAAPWPTVDNINFDDIGNDPNEPSEIYISSRALQTVFLKNCHQHFKVRSREILKHFRQPREVKPHATLPIVMEESRGKSSEKRQRQLRVIDHSARKCLTNLQIELHYKILIAWIYDLHERILHRANLPTYAFRLQHGKLIDWLEVQIFTPPTGLPVMGTIESPASKRFDWKDHRFGSIQSQLINYFGQPLSLSANAITSSLVKEFMTLHPDDYLASKYYPETLIKKSESSEFLAIRSVLIGQAAVADDQLGYYDPNDNLLLVIQVRFENKYKQAGKRGVTLRSAHPKLPIAAYHPEYNSDKQILRILYKNSGKLIQMPQLPARFKSLATTVDFFHKKLIHILGIKVIVHMNERRKLLLEWLIKSILNPSKGLTVLGPVETDTKKMLAPWEEPDNQRKNLFGEVQLAIMEHFSEYHPENDKKEESAIFILCSYYFKHRWGDFRHLYQLILPYTVGIGQNNLKRKLDLSGQSLKI